MELTLRPLTLEEGKEVFDREMVRDFPADELKPWPMMEALAQCGQYDMLGAFRGEEMVGYAWQFVPPGEGYVLLDYLAVLPQGRNAGLGSRMLELLRAYYRQTIVLESEEPAYAPDPVMARRRLGFYRRCAMVQTPLQLKLFGVRFTILASREIGNPRAVMERLYRGLLGESLAQRAVEYL